MRPGIILAALALAAIGLAAFSIGSASAKDNPVAVGDLYFCSEANQAHVCQTDITAGDSVTWTVTGGSHTVTQCTDATFASCSGGFNSDTLNQAGIYTRTFDSPGSYFYNCAFHPTFMMGKVVVAAATATPTAAPTNAATASPTVAPSLPSTGGAPEDSGVAVWLYGLLALGGVLLAGSGWSFALARKR
jgi:plastocyanin